MTDAEARSAVAARHGLSQAAVQALADGLARGGGGAQWNHPDLGGMGQWSSGGMLQIGDMFNDALKARIRAAIGDLVHAGAAAGRDGGRGASAESSGRQDWWPAGLGRPSSTGSQNDMHYACFPKARRLVVKQGSRVTLYDTGAHRLTGFAQSQGGRQLLEFSGPDGRVALEALKIVS
jgi:hypothetical protein